MTAGREGTTREADLDDGAVEELLFGWCSKKTQRERKTNEFRKFEVLSFPLFSRFLIFNQ
jgi:hypothetical protein